MKTQRKTQICYVIDLICRHFSARLDYVIHYLTIQLGIQITQRASVQERNPDSVLLNFTNEAIDQSVSIYNSQFLFEKGISHESVKPAIKGHHGVQLFTAAKDRFHINFDLLSAIFYCLSRYEEYSEFEADDHGRFSGKQSHAFKYGYLQEPVVDQWVNLLKTELTKHSSLQLDLKSYLHISPTIDVDSAWAFKNRSVIHSAGSVIKNALTLKWDRITEQLAVSKTDADPYDQFSFLETSLQDFKVLYFFLMHFDRPYDTAHYVETNAFHDLVKHIDTHSRIGIHPSYASCRNIEQVNVELKKLSQLLGRSITLSRQHFLKLSLPETYQNLIDIGIEADYSMGYGDQLGFRAGTSKDFKWYNVEKEEMTDLSIHPFCLMDVTLKDYLNLSTEEAIKEIQHLKKIIMKEGGTFSFIWHNSSFAEIDGWAGWESVFESLLS